MNYSFILITAFAVSIDSFFAGMTFKSDGRINYKNLFVATFVIFLTCLAGNLTGRVVRNDFGGFLSYAGGATLILTGLYNLFANEKEVASPLKKNVTVTESLIVGFAVGTDGCIANLSLAVTGYTSLFVPVVTTFMHFVLIYLGTFLKSKLDGFAEKTKALSPTILVILGLYKIMF